MVYICGTKGGLLIEGIAARDDFWAGVMNFTRIRVILFFCYYTLLVNANIIIKMLFIKIT